VLACALALPATLAASTHRASAVRVLDAVEVGSTLTGEFGFARPTGLAYVPGKKLLLVAASGPGRTRLLRIGPFEEALGAFNLPKISNTSTLAFDPFRLQLTAIDGKKRITVNAVAPGWVRTPLTEPFLTDDLLSGRQVVNPVGRIGEPADIARAVAWLVHPSSSYVNGSVVVVDGGQTAMLPLPWEPEPR